jgi:hypothetical protein
LSTLPACPAPDSVAMHGCCSVDSSEPCGVSGQWVKFRVRRPESCRRVCAGRESLSPRRGSPRSSRRPPRGRAASR